MGKSAVSILVVTHNHQDHIPKLLNSLQEFGYTNVYFCDAASSDNTLQILKSSPYSNNVLVKEKLESFSKNNNDLIRYFGLSSKYFLLLNPDIYFDTDFIKVVYDGMEADPAIGIGAPLLLNPDKTLQVSWKEFPSVFQAFKKRLGLTTIKNEKQAGVHKLDWCLGACLMIRNDLLKENNTLLDERYRLYCEDADICFEAWQKKFKVEGFTGAYAYHHLHQMSSRQIFSKYNYWNISSIFKFAIKWNIKYFVK